MAPWALDRMVSREEAQSGGVLDMIEAVTLRERLKLRAAQEQEEEVGWGTLSAVRCELWWCELWRYELWRRVCVCARARACSSEPVGV